MPAQRERSTWTWRRRDAYRPPFALPSRFLLRADVAWICRRTHLAYPTSCAPSSLPWAEVTQTAGPTRSQQFLARRQIFSASVSYVKSIKDERKKPLVNGRPQQSWDSSRHDGELLERKAN